MIREKRDEVRTRSRKIKEKERSPREKKGEVHRGYTP